jgi:hypothetical protein
MYLSERGDPRDAQRIDAKFSMTVSPLSYT